jgi:hypothetical protein
MQALMISIKDCTGPSLPANSWLIEGLEKKDFYLVYYITSWPPESSFDSFT